MTPSLRARLLREWRPLSDADTLTTRRAAPIAHVLPTVMKGIGLERRLQESRVLQLWPEIVGTEIARHAQPLAMRNGVLTVAVDHPIWLQELSRYHKSLLLQKLQKAVGAATVRNLTFRIG